MAAIKPIKVWVTPPGPNSWKSVWLLEYLNIPYYLHPFRFENIKKPPFTDICPNGRVPAIEDPNTEMILWETGAINDYIIEEYDTDHELSYEGLKERHLCNQMLAFQLSGQGPYFGQMSWFRHLHFEKYQPAIDRYTAEVRRVLQVLEAILSKNPAGSEWLVGDKMTYADMSFLPWNARLSEAMQTDWDGVFEGVPLVRAWHERMVEAPSWKKIMGVREKLMEEQNLQWNGVPEGIEDFKEYTDKIEAGEV